MAFVSFDRSRASLAWRLHPNLGVNHFPVDLDRVLIFSPACAFAHTAGRSQAGMEMDTLKRGLVSETNGEIDPCFGLPHHSLIESSINFNKVGLHPGVAVLVH